MARAPTFALSAAIATVAAIGLTPSPASSGGTGQPAPESVVPPDTRKQVTDTTRNVPRRVVLLSITYPGSQFGFQCSGFMIGVARVATAGHCVYNTDLQEFADSAVASPGANGAFLPFGSCTATSGLVPQQWSQNENPSFDVGYFDLDCSVGATTGVFKLKKLSSLAVGNVIKVNGYAGELTPGTQWKGKGNATVVGAAEVFYDTDTTPGESGAPVYNKKLLGCICVLAVHTTGTGRNPVFPYNGGVRITMGIKNFLLAP
jgi:glutamyl endopeptidase